MKPFTAREPCPICGGHRDLKPGHGIRCWGFLSDDGRFAHCTREEIAGAIEVNGKSQTYAHLLEGACLCGQTHGIGTVSEIGEARGAKIVASYDYRDESGKLVYQVVRKEPKTFIQRRPDGAGGWIWDLKGVTPTLYRLPELVLAVAAGDPVWIAEGEKDVDSLHDAGCVATCNSGGAGKWKARFAKHFCGANVTIVRDKDDAGNSHAKDVLRSIRDVTASVRVVEARTGKDVHDHLSAGHRVDEMIPVWPLDDIRKQDPVAWKRLLVYQSREAGDPFRQLDIREALSRDPDPVWPTGLEGEPSILPNFRGVTIIVGAPSSGKSYLAVASACQATYAGWSVLYLSSEMGDRLLARRLRAYHGADCPVGLVIQQVDFGAGVGSLVDLVADHIGERRLLIVFDSISSFVDQTSVANEHDVHRIGPLKQLTMWAVNLRRNTQGEVSFLILSETNAEGRTKGRFGDHKADLVVRMSTDEDHPSVKHVSVVKGWEYQIGEVGTFGLDVSTARLSRFA